MTRVIQCQRGFCFAIQKKGKNKISKIAECTTSQIFDIIKLLQMFAQKFKNEKEGLYEKTACSRNYNWQYKGFRAA